MTPPKHYYLGAPLWALPAWKGTLFTANAKPAEFLEQYAEHFNAVEGNTTFYATPSETNVDRWLHSTPDTFRFSFKFPKDITHKAHLVNVTEATNAFLKRLAPLGQRLHYLIQLPASFKPAELPKLEAFIKQLPTEYTYAVEVRHPEFFTKAPQRQALNEVLAHLKVDRVIFDSRAVHAAPKIDQATEEAQLKKPRLPVQLDTTALQPMLRHIGHPIQTDNEPWLLPWVAQTARWIQEGKTPFIYLHTPSNVGVPEVAQWFQEQVNQRLSPRQET